MPNPFPGVNPYVEVSGRWEGFHQVLVADLSKALNRVLPDNYIAIVEERIEPAVRTLAAYEELPESYIDVRSVPDDEPITSIELLSPTNKTAPGRGEYWAKRAGLLRGTASLVEIDLLLGGRRPAVREPMPAGDYFAIVSRGDRRPQCEVYARPVRRALPRLPVPLRAGEPDVVLELAAAYETTYTGDRYDRAVRHDRPLAGPLSDADRASAAGRVAGVGPSAA